MEDLEKGVHISELYDLCHRNDNELHQGYNYKDNALKNTLSKQLFKNDDTNNFLLRLEQMVVCLMESNMLLRTWFNHNVSKYYDRHPN